MTTQTSSPESGVPYEGPEFVSPPGKNQRQYVMVPVEEYDALRRHAQSTLEDMARLSASEVACYRWPEDTAEHRAMRAAFCDGAAHTAVTSTDGTIQPHIYMPDYQAIGDCRVCGHEQDKPWHALTRPDGREGA